MKNLSGIIILIILAGNISFATGIKRKANLNKEKIDTFDVVAKVPFVPNATIITPMTVIYDDAINPDQHCGYTLYDQNNKQVLRVRPSVMNPVTLKLKEGDYIVKLDSQKSPVYRIAVVENQFNEFVIE